MQAALPEFDDELLDADARVLLVRDEAEDQVAVERPRGGNRPGGVEDGGHAAFHIERAAPVEAVALDPAVEGRLGHVRDADGVRMPAEDEAGRVTPPRAGEDGHHTSTTRRGLIDIRR